MYGKIEDCQGEFFVKKSVHGDQAWPALHIFLEQFGLRQSEFAKTCGLTRQIFSDIKAGRRHFSRKIAEQLIAAGKNEVWGSSIQHVVNQIFSPPKYEGLDEYFDEPEPDSTQKTLLSQARLPLLTAPFCGDPILSPCFHGEYVNVPGHLADLAFSAEPPYILQLQNDDGYNRLRHGDLLLMTQAVDLIKEIKVVEYGGMLLLARALEHARVLYHFSEAEGCKDGWVTLDSGAFLDEGDPVGCVMGIVWAPL